MTIASMIDHTLLKADATKEQVKQLCNEAAQHSFATVCVNPHYVAYCTEQLKESDVKVCTVIGFPLGANKTEVKVFEAEQAVKDGAEEIDYVLNVSDIKNGEFEAVQKEMEQIVSVKQKHPNFVVKVILEVCYLTADELKKVSDIARQVGIDFVKTSTGFGSGGATEEAVKMMKEHAGQDVSVKASGGIRTAEDAAKYAALGVSRIGTSNGVAIVEGTDAVSEY